jgi:hypothetical protein
MCKPLRLGKKAGSRLHWLQVYKTNLVLTLLLSTLLFPSLRPPGVPNAIR